MVTKNNEWRWNYYEWKQEEINKIEFQIIKERDSNFINVCNYIEKHINRENLYINGET